MFSKLLKHDLRAVRKTALIISLSAIGASLVGGAALRAYFEMPKTDDMEFIRSLFMIAFTVSVFAVFATGIVISIFVFVRFYKNLYTDEGYLTFTLPTTRKSIHLAKTANAVIWTLYEILLFLVCAAIYLCFISPHVFEAFILLANAWPFSPFFTVGLVVISLLLLLFSSVFSVCTIQLCITIGALLAKRFKLIVGILSYYAISTVLQFALQAVALVFFLPLGTVLVKFVLSLDRIGIEIFVLSLFAFITAVTALLAAIAFSVTQRIMDKKLNLA